MLFFLIVEVDGTRLVNGSIWATSAGAQKKTAVVDSDEWISSSDSPANRCPTDSSRPGFRCPWMSNRCIARVFHDGESSFAVAIFAFVFL